jgi:hypothetical protein
MMDERVHSTFVDTPIGVLRIGAVERGVVSVEFVDRRKTSDRSFPHQRQLAAQLREYFDGTRMAFDEVPLIGMTAEF